MKLILILKKLVKEIISKNKTIPPNSEQEIIKEKKNCPQKIIQAVEKKINNFEIETSLITKGNNQYDSKIKEKYLIKDENMIKNVFINSPKEYGENLLKCINIFFIFCSIQFKARFEYDKKKYQCYKG